MQPDLLLAAALIGFGFGNAFLCSLVAFGVSAGRGGRVCAAFIGGRFAGIMVLGLVIALFGWYMDLDSRLMILIFAVLSLLFGILVLFWPKGLARLKLLRHCEAGGCGDSCQDTGSLHEGSGVHDCSSCAASGSCSREPARAGSQTTLRGHHSRLAKYQGLGTTPVLFLGFVRGATPCLKVLLLVPLILTLPFTEAMLLVAVFALASTIYPLMGILGAGILGTAVSERRLPQLTRAAAAMMICIGVYYLYKWWAFSCSGGV